ncbi:L-2-amino-thiazoline-4-carboxylic acid hydrolase [Tenuibacillus multivorans]|uniref:L-2-amino-thiazoline-4-carboxylic acid hydrolase n=1 Tax=Tenuibacillus multivorans TaxID=237069 RepID=A0A1H0DVD9_9BACI|nr:L-2-amino-thiazoline-4-carboxylic acid hydrolase [Tenuibacillus multivorans]GEL76763.1 hypothetical protein TMU01_09980 [Tenuibacillus multivorans]SDN74164.1 L-2-amino-thiazoline-4-carboxylic acid hydrolase [Tenuibacillus multivorans]
MSEPRLNIPPISMYAITAKLFTHVEKAIVSEFGQEGQKLIQQGVKIFGFKDAEDIAKQATMEKENHALFNYIPNNHQAKKNFENETIYALMAKLFAQITKPVVDEFGNQAKDAVRDGVRTFGEERGRGIAQRARANGEDYTIDHYLTNYDMGRSDLFTFSTEYKPNEIEQNFTVCPFGQQWADDNMHEYGILYCQMIDPAVARGFNPNFEVEHDQYVLREGNCHFRFKMQDQQNK